MRQPALAPDGWLSVGYLRRPHGLGGDLFVEVTTDQTDRFTVGSELFGAGRILTVERSRRAGENRLITKFVEIADRSEAQNLTNTELLAAPIDDPDALWVHDLIGKQVIDQNDADHGECVAVVDNPAAPLLELADGALVPTDFVVAVSEATIDVDVPEGLFEEQ